MKETYLSSHDLTVKNLGYNLVINKINNTCSILVWTNKANVKSTKNNAGDKND
jgi:ribonuclease HIII